MTYRTAFELTIQHNYYLNGDCPDIEVHPDASSHRVLQRLRMLFKQVSAGRWILLFPDDLDCTTAWQELFTVQLNVLSPSFWEYTQLNNESLALPAPQVLISNKTLRQALKEKPLQQNITFISKEVYWKYIFVPYVGEQAERELKLTDLIGNIEFEICPDQSIDNKTCRAFLSTRPIALSERYDYQLQLSVEKQHGNKILKQNIAYPRPGNYECGTPNETHLTIVNYIYY